MPISAFTLLDQFFGMQGDTEMLQIGITYCRFSLRKRRKLLNFFLLNLRNFFLLLFLSFSQLNLFILINLFYKKEIFSLISLLSSLHIFGDQQSRSLFLPLYQLLIVVFFSVFFFNSAFLVLFFFCYTFCFFIQ